MVPAGTQPQYRLVEPKLSLMEKRISELDTVIVKLVSLFPLRLELTVECPSCRRNSFKG